MVLHTPCFFPAASPSASRCSRSGSCYSVLEFSWGNWERIPKKLLRYGIDWHNWSCYRAQSSREPLLCLVNLTMLVLRRHEWCWYFCSQSFRHNVRHLTPDFKIALELPNLMESLLFLKRCKPHGDKTFALRDRRIISWSVFNYIGVYDRSTCKTEITFGAGTFREVVFNKRVESLQREDKNNAKRRLINKQSVQNNVRSDDCQYSELSLLLVMTVGST